MRPDFSYTVCTVVVNKQRIDYGNKYIGIVECVGDGFIICAGVLHNDFGFACQELQLLYELLQLLCVMRNFKWFCHDDSKMLHNGNHALSFGNIDPYCVHKTFLLCKEFVIG